jgi:hypothetical protein
MSITKSKNYGRYDFEKDKTPEYLDITNTTLQRVTKSKDLANQTWHSKIKDFIGVPRLSSKNRIILGTAVTCISFHFLFFLGFIGTYCGVILCAFKLYPRRHLYNWILGSFSLSFLYFCKTI